MKVRAPDGSIVEGHKIDFEETSTPWSTYKLKDGTVLKIKIQLVDVLRADFYNPQTGEPAYQIIHNLTVRATQVPDELYHLPNKPPAPSNQEVM